MGRSVISTKISTIKCVLILNLNMNPFASKSTAITVGSTALLTGATCFVGFPFLFPDAGGNVNVPLFGGLPARSGFAAFAALGALGGAVANNYVLPLIPNSFVQSVGMTVIGPTLTGTSMYALMALSSPASAAAYGLPNILLLGAGSNFVGDKIAQAWRPWLQQQLGS
jgi:hypothetical protein